MAEEMAVAPQELDYHAMWGGLGMDPEDHDMLLGAVGQMYVPNVPPVKQSSLASCEPTAHAMFHTA